MSDRKTRDILGLISCGIFALVVVGCGVVAVVGYLSEPGGHPSAETVAFIIIIEMSTFVPPVGVIFGIAGLAKRYSRDRTLGAIPSGVGVAANSLVFAVGAYFQFH